MWWVVVVLGFWGVSVPVVVAAADVDVDVDLAAVTCADEMVF